MAKTIAVDFDGVIHTYERGWADGSIYGDFMDNCMPVLMGLLDHYAVYVLTTRRPRQVVPWIERTSQYNIEAMPEWNPFRQFWTQTGLLLVTRKKLPAVRYIDDRAFQFTDWKSVEAHFVESE